MHSLVALSMMRLPRGAARVMRFSSATEKFKVGFIGLGAMGSKMALNLFQDGHSVVLYDKDAGNLENALSMCKTSEEGNKTVCTVKSIGDLVTAESVDVVVSMLPNDDVAQAVSNELLNHRSAASKKLLHVNCSTISPALSESLQTQHKTHGQWEYIASPVFARPDGITRRQAVFMMSGETTARNQARSLLQGMGRVEDFGENVGAGNVAKLCGNYLIAASIESMSEAMVLAEKHGVDREQVMNLLTSSIFDCLIYKGYGQRVSQRDHRPGGFALELGYKDVTLVQQAARRSKTTMPFLSVLCDRYTTARAKERSELDWSAIALNVAEDGGLDISKDLKRNMNYLKESQGLSKK